MLQQDDDDAFALCKQHIIINLQNILLLNNKMLDLPM